MTHGSDFLKTIVILSLGFGATLALSAELPPAADSRRSLELELEEVPESLGYEVEVVRLLSDDKKSEPMKFKLTSASWKATLAPGHYVMRVRSIDNRGVPGDWNEPKDFVVKIFPPKLLTPSDPTIIKSDDTKEEKIKFEWEAAPRATSYELKVQNLKQVVVYKETTKSTSLSAKIPVGEDYVWIVTPMADDGAEGEPSPTAKLQIIGAKLGKPNISKIAESDTRSVSWELVDLAQQYEMHLDFKKKDEWKDIFQKTGDATKVAFRGPLMTGTYRLRVRATAYDRQDSDFAVQEFDTISAKDLKRLSFDSGKRYYVKFSFGPSFFNYLDHSLDYNTDTTFATIGGIASLDGEMWFGKKEVWGITGNYQAIGGNLGNSFNMYNSLSTHGIRKLNFGLASQVRLYFGLQYMQLPDISADNTGNYYQRSVKIFGPSIKAEYYRGFSQKYGMKVGGQVSPGIGGSSYNGNDIKTQLSWQVGGGVTRHISQNVNSSLEYFYRNQAAGYAHYPQNAFPQYNYGVNTITLTSHNLVLSLEYGF